MARRNHAEMQELVGAFALDALEPDELAAMELHLAECPKCRAELYEHRETAALLAHAGTAAPDGLWEKIAAGLDEAPPDMATVFRMPMGEDREARLAAPKRANSVTRWRRTAIAAAGIAAALIAVNSALLLRQRNQIDDIGRSQTISHLADQAAGNPSSRIIRMVSADGASHADAVVQPNGTAYLLHTHLTKLDKDHTYQLWALADGKLPVSLSVLGRQPSVAGFTAKLPTIKQLAITIEKAGGATVPSQLPLVSGTL